MGRNRKYGNDAARQRAYRQRKAEEELKLKKELRRLRAAVAAKGRPKK